MAAREGVDALNDEAAAAFAARAGEGPGLHAQPARVPARRRFRAIWRVRGSVAPLLENVGGRPIFAGRPAEALIGEGEWDLMVLVEYPTRQALRAIDSLDADELRGG
jgi:hypothetical protein